MRMNDGPSDFKDCTLCTFSCKITPVASAILIGTSCRCQYQCHDHFSRHLQTSGEGTAPNASSSWAPKIVGSMYTRLDFYRIRGRFPCGWSTLFCAHIIDLPLNSEMLFLLSQGSLLRRR
ncbi:hypothetical protein ARMGADRAFT_672178 [Armillaria gallica]|uniref:Uncharacterized protein n=1 Tax=Armillaria gallica TaxID=47427 RepID=A0A2H3D7N6_ARMGA|nr:hypothetical protein ARMGADRAFT_672178 [Armillaria gallica]